MNNMGFWVDADGDACSIILADVKIILKKTQILLYILDFKAAFGYAPRNQVLCTPPQVWVFRVFLPILVAIPQRNSITIYDGVTRLLVFGRIKFY